MNDNYITISDINKIIKFTIESNYELRSVYLKGEISKFEHINKGFGFDSIFLYNGKFLSDMTLDEKNQISPRQIALTSLAKDKIFQKNLDLMK